MKTFEIVTTKTVTQEDVDFLLDAALAGPVMADWCELVEIGNEPTEKHSYLSEILTRGGDLVITDGEEEDESGKGKKYVLTLDKFLYAIGKVGVDFEDYDSVVADEVVQTAIFGEVIYG